jgi:DNA-binding transcriptional ArsR family regulator
MNSRHAFRSRIFKALGHPTRILIIDALLRQELCVCDLRELAGADMSTVSKHLSVLREAGIVATEKRGTSVYYSLRMECVRGFLACVDRFNSRRLEEEACILCADDKGMGQETNHAACEISGECAAVR